MLRKLLLPLLATAALAGCATDYQYRGGNGDYYYGQPRVEYRHSGPGGFYGDIGLGYGYGSYGFGATYYYDRYGRLVYGFPRGYYGTPYYGGNGWYPPRPRPPRPPGGHPGGHDGGGHGHNPDNQPDRVPPWRDLGQLQQRDPNQDGYRNRDARERRAPDQPGQRPRQESRPDVPARMQRSPSTAPVIRERRESSSSRVGSFIGGATRGSRDNRVED